jgi:hypothetical protein
MSSQINNCSFFVVSCANCYIVAINNDVVLLYLYIIHNINLLLQWDRIGN